LNDFFDRNGNQVHVIIDIKVRIDLGGERFRSHSNRRHATIEDVLIYN